MAKGLMEIKDGYRIGIYVRESRDENEENYETIETQKELLVDFIQKKSLGYLYKVYCDDNVSGSVFERPGLEQLKKDVLDCRIDLVVLKDLSRLGRNNAKTLLFLDFLEERGVRVLTFDARYDSLRDNDTVGIETWFNERYVRDISRKIRANIRYKIQKGEYLGHAPYGYRKSEKEKNRLCVEPEEARVVREIYDLYLEGYGYSSISKHLNRKGCLSPSGEPGGWNTTAIGRILQNRVYVGDTVQGVSEKISFKSKKTRRIPQSRWVVTPGTHERIIDPDTFNKVREMLRGKSHAPHKGKLHLFRGLLYCGRCNSPMFARARKDRPMGYICGSYCRGGTLECTSHYIREDTLHAVIREELSGLMKDSELMKKAFLAFEKIVSGQDAGEDMVRKLRSQLSQKKRQQEALYLDKLEGKITEDLFLRMNRQLEGRISGLEEELVRAEAQKVKIFDFEQVLSGLKEEIEKSGLTHAMVAAMVDRIVIYEPGEYTAFCGHLQADTSDEANAGAGVIAVEFRYGAPCM